MLLVTVLMVRVCTYSKILGKNSGNDGSIHGRKVIIFAKKGQSQVISQRPVHVSHEVRVGDGP